jgi:hypothetical protein
VTPEEAYARVTLTLASMERDLLALGWRAVAQGRWRSPDDRLLLTVTAAWARAYLDAEAAVRR